MNHHVYAAELRTIRRGLSLAVGDLAELLDVDVRRIARWESGVAPVPTSVIDALHLLEIRMRARIDQRCTEVSIGAGVALYRTRAELDSAHPFYADLPIALYEYEVAQLRARRGARPVYTAAWIENHPSRSRFAPSAIPLEQHDPEGLSFSTDAGIPGALAELLDGRLQPGYGPGTADAIAYAPDVDPAVLAAAGTAGIQILQPWEDGPDVSEILALTDKLWRVDIYVSEGRLEYNESRFVLEVAGYTTIDGATWSTEIPARLPWIGAAP